MLYEHIKTADQVAIKLHKDRQRHKSKGKQGKQKRTQEMHQLRLYETERQAKPTLSSQNE